MMKVQFREKKLIFLLFILLSAIFYNLGEASMKKDIFEIEIKLYTAGEIKQFFPSIDLVQENYGIMGSSYNYLFGWVKLKEGERDAFVREKTIPACRIKTWNKFFEYTLNIESVSEQKSYFLIPLGNIYIPDRNFEYRILTIP